MGTTKRDPHRGRVRPQPVPPASARPNAWLLLDDVGAVTVVSPEARTLLGARGADLVGRSIAELVAPEDRLRVTRWLTTLRLVDRHAEGGRRRSTTFNVERRYGLPAGAVARSLPENASGARSTIVELSGARAGADAESVDDQLAALRQHIDQLARSNQQLASLASTAAHDLQAPLAAMSASAELLARRAGAQLDETSQEVLATLLRGLGRMSHLVDGLMRCSVAGVRLAIDAVDCDVLVEQVVDELRIELDTADAMVSIAPVGVVVADGEQLRSVFRNLILNAVRYRSPERRLHIWIDADDEHVERQLTITDNGMGIAPQDRDRVFGMFERASSDAAGSGIGLAHCQRVIEGHGGRIWIEDGLDGGTAVRFTLPAQRLDV